MTIRGGSPSRPASVRPAPTRTVALVQRPAHLKERTRWGADAARWLDSFVRLRHINAHHHPKICKQCHRISSDCKEDCLGAGFTVRYLLRPCGPSKSSRSTAAFELDGSPFCRLHEPTRSQSQTKPENSGLRPANQHINLGHRLGVNLGHRLGDGASRPPKMGFDLGLLVSMCWRMRSEASGASCAANASMMALCSATDF